MRVELRLTTVLHNYDGRHENEDSWHTERINTDFIIRDYPYQNRRYIHLDGVKMAVHPDDVGKLEAAMVERVHWIDRLFDRWGWK